MRPSCWLLPVIVVLGTAVGPGLRADTPAAVPETAAQREARMAWWREARFGLFIHWGLYAIPAGEWGDQTHHGEWIMHSARIPVEEYEQLATRFDPQAFDADAWVRIAKSAGMKYIVITSKHHDGFCLFDSARTPYDIMSTPFERDIMRELAEACRRADLQICWYHSIMDWHHPDYLPRRGWEQRSAEGADYGRYVEHLHGQVRELLTRYGPIGVMWFDGEWEGTWTHAMGRELYDLVRSIQPDTIVNNRVDKGRGGMGGLTREARFAGDFGTPEQEIPATGLPGVDWETCMTMNHHWGYNRLDADWKSSTDLIRKLADIASKGGNFLLNVGPTAEGRFPQPCVERLEDMGRWMRVNGEAIYSTRASPFKTLAWGRCTHKSLENGDTRLYLHVFDWPADGQLVVPGLFNAPRGARLLAAPSGAQLNVTRREDALVVTLPPQAPDPVNTVVVLDIAGPPDVNEPPQIAAAADIFVGTTEVAIRSERSNVELRYTLDGAVPSGDSPVVRGPVRLTATTTVSARAFRDGQAVSDVATARFTKVVPRPAVQAGDTRPGVAYEYFEGEWDELPDFDALIPDLRMRGQLANFELSPRRRPERFALRYRGIVSVPQEGVYHFHTLSDDGSRLSIGGEVVVDNDGLHGVREGGGRIALAAGAHPLTVTFFEKTGSELLEVWYSGPGADKQRLPDSMLSCSTEVLIPRPSAAQLAWQRRELQAFVHFGLNTFTDREWGEGADDPALFDPTELDARQWVRIFREAGMKQVVLTAKHHDGFCLWPSRTTDYSVAASPWRGGRGDLVRELADACREAGLKLGIYLSPWDRHERCYGSEAYNEFYKRQLTELLTDYGPIHEVWFDGACGEGPNGRRQVYDWAGYVGVVRRLQPEAVIFSDAGPDVRWVGNESGLAGKTNWSTLWLEGLYPGTPAYRQLTRGHADGSRWVPAECNVSIRPGWFYHPDQDVEVKSVEALVDIYYKSVGRNGLLHVNVPPDRRGLIHETDAARLTGMRAVLDETFRDNLATGRAVSAVEHAVAPARLPSDETSSPAELAVDGHTETAWVVGGARRAALTVELGEPRRFDRALIQEDIRLGQRIRAFRIEAFDGKAWQWVAQGTTVGYKRLLRFRPITATRVRLTILDARAGPAVSEFGLFEASPREPDFNPE